MRRQFETLWPSICLNRLSHASSCRRNAILPNGNSQRFRSIAGSGQVALIFQIDLHSALALESDTFRHLTIPLIRVGPNASDPNHPITKHRERCSHKKHASQPPYFFNQRKPFHVQLFSPQPGIIPARLMHQFHPENHHVHRS